MQTYAVIAPDDLRSWQNLMMAAGSIAPPATSDNPELQRMLDHALPPPANDMAPLTDEFAPIDRYISASRP